MRVFVTGATGFIGSKLVGELIAAGHSVKGLARNEAAASNLRAAGVEAFMGNLEDLDSLRAGAKGMDAAINLAFDHDMSKFKENSDNEAAAIQALGEALEPGKLLMVTSGVALIPGAPGYVRVETDAPLSSDAIPRRGEMAAQEVAARGIGVGVLRMSQIHDVHKQGLTTYLVQIAQAKGVSAYIGDGSPRWAAAHVNDVARLYRLALEQTGTKSTIYHAVGEEGVSIRDMAEAIGTRLNLPVRSISQEEAAAHFGPFAHFVGLDMPASSAWTQQTLGWTPTGRGMVADLLELEA